MKHFWNAILCMAVAVVAAACGSDPASPDSESAPSAFARSRDTKAPTKPTNFRSTSNTSWSVSLAWDPSTDNSGSIASYRVRDNWGREITVSGTQTSIMWKYPAHPPLQAGSTYTFTVYAMDAAGNKSASSSPITVRLPQDTEAPTVPTFSVKSLGTRHITLAWSSTDDSPFISYRVTKDGVPISSGWIAESSKTFSLLQPGTTYTFTAQARDRASNVPGGNESAFSAPFSVTTPSNDGSDVTPPTQPSPVGANLYNDGSTEMEVLWGASTDNVTPQHVIIYEVYVNGVLENTVIGRTQAHAYGVFGENIITVIAIDEAGNRSTAGQTRIVIA